MEGRINHTLKPKNITNTGVNFYTLVIVFSLLCASTIPLLAQQKNLVQVKTFDQQLKPFTNIEISINDKEFISVGNKGVVFIELSASDLPLRSVMVKDNKLEAASWNYSKGIVEIIIRKKSYQLIGVFVRDGDNTPLKNLKVVFDGVQNLTLTTNGEGRIEIPLPLEENLESNRFSIPDHRITKLHPIGEQTYILTVNRIAVASKNEGKSSKPQDLFRNFDLSKIDSIQSLTAFYAIFKNYQMQDLDEATRKRLDEKFNALVKNLQHGEPEESQFIGKISDSSFVADDIENLLAQAEKENEALVAQRNDVDQKVKILRDKLALGVENMDAESRTRLMSDLTRLEMILQQNENQFYKNQNDYRNIINSLKEEFFDFEHLESKLSESEARRLEEQRIFRQKLLAISLLVLIFGVLIILLINLSNKLRKQKKELIRVNSEINRINGNLEGLVTERTRMLADANKELDTFLYRASHDLRSPVCSIVGLCNIALHFSNGESKDLVEKVVHTTFIMDKLLKKLSIISEINQPTGFSTVNVRSMIESIRDEFQLVMKDQPIQFTVNCAEDVVIESYPNLLEAILSNLIENALFYTLIKDPTNAKVEITAINQGSHLSLSVYDNGIGVEHTISDRVYDMFFKGTEQSKGNGLGLYIVHKSVHALGGKIAMESQSGLYTKFEVSLPMEFPEVQRTVLQINEGVTASDVRI
ncbi:MAG TPA: ATP-binding protein [Ohtaekwangia sp.]|nr:ATP-binding protein [Ohtaekwangia sp.]